MKKYIYMVFMVALMCACSKPDSAEVCVGKIEVGAVAGSISVSVETEGDWRVETDQAWLKTDVQGRSGNGAFTVYYESNESDIMNRTTGRIGKATLRLEGSLDTYDIVFVQQGFYPVEAEVEVVNHPSLVLEYHVEELTDVVLLSCSSEGTGDIQAWIDSQNADIVVLDGDVKGEIDGLNVRGCNYAGLTDDQKYEAFKTMIQRTYNSGPDAGDDWIYAGQMYHYSAMQAGYDNTPAWYPVEKASAEFRSDIYAWQNNLFDCVWMYKRNYVETYTDKDGKSYCADYVYASSSVFAKVVNVELLDVDGMSHKAIKLTLKY